MNKMRSSIVLSRWLYSFVPISVTLIFFGVNFIIESLIDVQSLKSKIGVQDIAKFKSHFTIREDISLNQKLTKYKNIKKDISNDTNSSINLNDFNLEDVILKGEIPAFNIEQIPNDFHLTKDLKIKKEKFIYLILPSVVQENVKIRTDRKKLLKINNFLVSNKTLNKKDQKFLILLAKKYKVNTHNKHKIDVIQSLLKKVDEIPNSIVLAQAANESGWGTSRFAKEFNALFGEYTFDTTNGVVPELRDEGEKYLIKYFSSINESVGSYFKNLNTHPAYKSFRDKRDNVRKKNQELNPINLTNYLKPYAKDKNYIKIIKSIIKTNDLLKFDKVKNIITKS